jgi:hypothetical protein
MIRGVSRPRGWGRGGWPLGWGLKCWPLRGSLRCSPGGQCGGTRCVLPLAKLRSNSRRKSEVKAGCARCGPLAALLGCACTPPPQRPAPAPPPPGVTRGLRGKSQEKSASSAFDLSASSYQKCSEMHHTAKPWVGPRGEPTTPLRGGAGGRCGGAFAGGEAHRPRGACASAHPQPLTGRGCLSGVLPEGKTQRVPRHRPTVEHRSAVRKADPRRGPAAPPTRPTPPRGLPSEMPCCEHRPGKPLATLPTPCRRGRFQ